MSENQRNKGGLLRQGGPAKHAKTLDEAGAAASNKRTKEERMKTRINKTRGGKRRARTKRSGKTAWRDQERDSENPNFSVCPSMFVETILRAERALRQQLISFPEFSPDTYSPPAEWIPTRGESGGIRDRRKASGVRPCRH
jgi:hypothetical protein